MTTKQAFINLLDSPDLIKKLNMNHNTLRTIKKRIRDNNEFSIKVMEGYLIKSGAKKKPEIWRWD